MFSLQIVSIWCMSSQILTAMATEPCPSPTASEYCLPSWQKWGGSCYHLTPPGTWEATELACRQLGGKIAAPQSLAENEFFVSQIPQQYGYINIGCDDRLNETMWICEGEKAEFVNWVDGAPDGGTETPEDCAVLFRSHGKWQDGSCNTGSVPGICKRCIVAAFRQSRTYALAVDEAGMPLNSCLLDHVIREFSTLSIPRCANACLQMPRCRSFNFMKNEGHKTCQLNNSTRTDVPDKFAEIGVLCAYADESTKQK